jgi:hypothetical protein
MRARPYGRAGRWLINEKGMVSSAGRLHVAPSGFADQAHALLACPGTSPAELEAVLDKAALLVTRTNAACKRSR